MGINGTEQRNGIVCPYKDNRCPKIDDQEERYKRIERKLDFVIMIIVALHGAEIASLLATGMI